MEIQIGFSLVVNQSLVSLTICIIKRDRKKRKGSRKGKKKKENRN